MNPQCFDGLIAIASNSLIKNLLLCLSCQKRIINPPFVVIINTKISMPFIAVCPVWQTAPHLTFSLTHWLLTEVNIMKLACGYSGSTWFFWTGIFGLRLSDAGCSLPITDHRLFTDYRSPSCSLLITHC